MRRQQKRVVTPVSLREVYAQPGDYSAKMMIDPLTSAEIESVDVQVRNGDGRPMDYSFRRWGTKLTVSFKIDSATPDGVSVIDLFLRRKGSETTRERLSFWVIK